MNFGDGSPVTGGVGLPPTHRDHTYLAVGSFTATLGLTDDLGRASRYSATLDAAGPAIDYFTAKKVAGSGTGSDFSAPPVTGSYRGLTPGRGAAWVTSVVDYRRRE